MKWMNRIKFMKIAKIAGLVSLALAVTMGIFTFFGANGGNFVVNIKPHNGVSIVMYDNTERVRPATRLAYQSVIDQMDATYSWLPSTIDEGLGDKNDYKFRRYTALSFVLRNESTVPVNLRANIEMSNVVKGVDSAVRVMMIVDGVRNIYGKLKESPDIDAGKPETFPESTKPFLSPIMVCEENYSNLAMMGELKFTIVIWLEGEDLQCVDAIKGGSMRLLMNIMVV